MGSVHIARRLLLPGFLAIILLAPAALRAEVFFLHSGGKIEGELLNVNEVPRETYRVKTEDGVEISFDKRYLADKRTVAEERLAEYNAFAPFREDTVENHLEIAQWCSENGLRDLSRRHLYQILELDSNHAKARQLLNHSRASDGSWVSREDSLASRGLIRTASGWRTQQQIDVEQIFERRRQAEVAWSRKVAGLCDSLPGNPKAREEMLAIVDPAAVPSLAAALPKSSSEVTRSLTIRALSNIGSKGALEAIAAWSLNGQELAEVRRTCIEEIKKHEEALPLIKAFYIGQLHAEQGVAAINAAAFALGELGATSAIPDLIKALVTQHSQTRTVQAANPGINNQGIAGLQWGAKTETRTVDSQNQGVLSALIRLTGKNFSFDQNAWMNWLLETRRTKPFNGRRG